MQKNQLEVFEKVRTKNAQGEEVEAYAPYIVDTLDVEYEGEMITVIRECGNFYPEIGSTERMITLEDLMEYRQDDILVKKLYQRKKNAEVEQYELRPVQLLPVYVANDLGEFFDPVGFEKVPTLEDFIKLKKE